MNPRISIISAIAKNNRAIGLNNQLLWHIPEDLQYFKKITKGHPVIMGQKTYESMGKLLPERLNIVLTLDKKLKINGCKIRYNINDAVKLASQNDKKEIFFIGGGSIYKQALPFVDRLYLTLVEGNYQADTFFPDYSEFTKVISSKKSSDKKYQYEFVILEK